MEKLTTDKLKQLITVWLSTPELKHKLDEYYVNDTLDRENLDRIAGYFDIPNGASSAEINERIYTKWCDGSQWKRVSKRQLGEDWDSYFSISNPQYGGDGEPGFAGDFCQG